MADLGAGTGIFQGIGDALGSLGERLDQQHIERQKQRDLIADHLERQGKDIADNIMRVGGWESPEAAPMIEQLKKVTERHNQLFPPHETPALIQRLQKIIGHKPAEPKPDARAGLSVEDVMARARRPEFEKTPAGQRQQAGLNREISGADAQAAADFKRKQDEENLTRVSEENRGILQDVQAGMPPALLKPPAEKSGQWKTISGTLKNGEPFTFLHSASTNEATDMEGRPLNPGFLEGFKETSKSAAKADNSPQGRLARALFDSGENATPEEANAAAAKSIVAAEKAKAKAAESAVTGRLSPDEAMALARTDIILGRTTAFGLGRSEDRFLYNRAKANLMMGGQLGGVLGQKADVDSIKHALSTMQTMKASVGAFQKTLESNLDQVLELSKKVSRTGSSLANDYLLYSAGRLADYPELQAFRVAVNTAANEYARIANSATGGGVSTDSARNEALSLLNTGLSSGALESAVRQMQIDARNRITGMDETISGLQQSMTTTPNMPGAPPTQATPGAFRQPGAPAGAGGPAPSGPKGNPLGLDLPGF